MNGYVEKIGPNNDRPWKIRGPLLSKLDFELTERCNNNCIHCYINQPAEDLQAKRKELPTEEIKGILEEAVALGCLTVRFTGGEPVLREDFEELYLFARKLGLRVLVFTNATLITPRLADLFARIPPLAFIEVTIFGMNQSSYETVTRHPGSHASALRGIRLLQEREVPFVVKSVILPPNRKETEALESWASTLPWMGKPPHYSMFLDLRCRRDSKGKNRMIKGLRLSPDELLRFIDSRKDDYVKEMKGFCSKFMGPPGDNLFLCDLGAKDCCVDAYGNLQPCMSLRHPQTTYYLKKGSLRDALLNFFPRIKEMKAKNPHYLSRCARCFLMGLCEQCPAKSWMEHGTLDTPVEYLCEMAHTQARYLGFLGAEEAWEVEDWQERIRRGLWTKKFH